MLQAAIQQHPASVHLFVYADEVNPGSPLAPDPTRNLWLIYLSFQEFGPTALSQEEAYLFSVKGDGGIRPCILRKNIISAANKDLDDEDAIFTSDIFQECDLQFTTENDWRRTLLRLLEKLDATDFDCWQKACGITFNPHAMIFNHKLAHIVKPISHNGRTIGRRAYWSKVCGYLAACACFVDCIFVYFECCKM